jgi:hypothetical protein
MGRGTFVQREQTVLPSKLWSYPKNALQQSSDDHSVENTVDCLPFRHIYFMNYTSLSKNVISMGFVLHFANESLRFC